MSDDPFTDLITSSPGLAERILTEHTADSYGQCVKCSGQRTWTKFPCTLVWHAEQAVEARKDLARRRGQVA